jgi:hypothetical protein
MVAALLSFEMQYSAAGAVRKLRIDRRWMIGSSTPFRTGWDSRLRERKLWLDGVAQSANNAYPAVPVRLGLRRLLSASIIASH